MSIPYVYQDMFGSAKVPFSNLTIRNVMADEETEWYERIDKVKKIYFAIFYTV